MKKEVTLLLVVIAFACGFLAGHSFQRHHYVVVGELPDIVLIDSGTEQVCNPFPTVKTYDSFLTHCPD